MDVSMICIRHARRALMGAACTIALLASGVALATPTMMPLPRVASFDGGMLPLGGGVRVSWDQGRPTPLLERAASRFATRLSMLSAPRAGVAPVLVHISVEEDPAYLSVREKEHYTLQVDANGVVLKADGPAGVLHGLATVLQLVEKTPQGDALATGSIDDTPRFSWRGIMLDVSRHFLSVETVERQIDAMELTKLNVLHWHLSDGTGFRVESRLYPKLQAVGGHHQYYTQAQIRAIVRYASDRGVRIVPEFDVPGHTLSLLQAYPSLAAQQPVPLTQAWLKTCQTKFGDGGSTTSCGKGVNLNNSAMDPTRPDVVHFVAGLFGEMGGLFPDRYFHSGGDEVVSKQWTTNPQIAAYMKAHGYADAPAMQAAFTAAIQKVLASKGKIMMGWDEVSEAPIPADVVVEAWRGSKWIASATKAGHPVVVSSGYYLDLLRPSREHYAVDPTDVQGEGSHGDAGGKDDPFAADPTLPPLTPEQEKLVLGGEAPLWSEVVTDEMTDARLWPRSAAIAERYWSSRDVRDIDDMERRLPGVYAELEALGLEASQNRARMIARLTPANITPLTVFTDVTVPVMNYALNKLNGPNSDKMLSAPVAIAEPDSFIGIRFNALAARYGAGDHASEADLRSMLTMWQANDAAYATIATTPDLQLARPVSQRLAALATTGLEALEAGRHSRAWREKAQAQLAEQDAAFASCATHASSLKEPLPPSGLLISIVPGLHALVNTAR